MYQARALRIVAWFGLVLGLLMTADHIYNLQAFLRSETMTAGRLQEVVLHAVDLCLSLLALLFFLLAYRAWTQRSSVAAQRAFIVALLPLAGTSAMLIVRLVRRLGDHEKLATEVVFWALAALAARRTRNAFRFEAVSGVGARQEDEDGTIPYTIPMTAGRPPSPISYMKH